VLFVGTRKVKCRAALALRMAAQSLHHSKSALGDFYRRMRAKLGAPKAITAAAHKLARIIFHLISTRQEFDDSKFAADQLHYQKRQEAKLHAKAKSMGYALIPLEPRVEFLSSGTLPCRASLSRRIFRGGDSDCERGTALPGVRLFRSTSLPAR
jgi:hypothetical protein